MKQEQFTVPPNFPFPRKRSVIVKKIEQGTITTSAGIELIESSANNAQKPNVGLIYAVGSEVPDDLKPGLKVYYNQYADLEILIDGRPYVMMDEMDVKCILNEGNFMPSLIIPAKEVGTAKRIDAQMSRHKRLEANKLNVKDKVTEINKQRKKK